MARGNKNEDGLQTIMDQLLVFGETAPSIEEKIVMANLVRSYSRDFSSKLDRVFLERIEQCHNGLESASANQEKLKELLNQLTAPPLHPAIFLELTPDASLRMALVMNGNSGQVVQVSREVDILTLEPGDEVLLSHEGNCIIDKSPSFYIRAVRSRNLTASLMTAGSY